MTTEAILTEVLSGVGTLLDFAARTQRGWVRDMATILSGAANVASELLEMGQSPEEIRAILEDLKRNPPQAASHKGAHQKVDAVIAERKKEQGGPPKVP